MLRLFYYQKFCQLVTVYAVMVFQETGNLLMADLANTK